MQVQVDFYYLQLLVFAVGLVCFGSFPRGLENQSSRDLTVTMLCVAGVIMAGQYVCVWGIMLNEMVFYIRIWSLHISVDLVTGSWQVMHNNLRESHYLSRDFVSLISTPSVLVCVRMGSMHTIQRLISMSYKAFLHQNSLGQTGGPQNSHWHMSFCYVLKLVVWTGLLLIAVGICFGFILLTNQEMLHCQTNQKKWQRLHNFRF